MSCKPRTNKQKQKNPLFYIKSQLRVRFCKRSTHSSLIPCILNAHKPIQLNHDRGGVGGNQFIIECGASRKTQPRVKMAFSKLQESHQENAQTFCLSTNKPPRNLSKICALCETLKKQEQLLKWKNNRHNSQIIATTNPINNMGKQND